MRKNYFKTIVLTVIVVLTCTNVWSQNGIAISSAEDLQKIGVDENYPIDGNYYLTQDIDLGNIENWIPIGSTNKNDRFKGVFDGKGYSIKNLTIISGSFRGLFVRLGAGSVVKDFDLVNVNIVTEGSPVGAVTGAILGGSTVQRVSVSGTITGSSEVGGIAGRVARDATEEYNTIQDCFVSATIKATKTTNSDESALANSDNEKGVFCGGIVGSTHSSTPVAPATPTNFAKIKIERTYFTGSVSTTVTNNVAANAAGILAYYNNHQYVMMSEVLVLADEIISGTPNYFFCRRGVTGPNLELLEKLYVRDDLPLTYFNPADPGFGTTIPYEKVDTLPLSTFKTAQFYIDNLTWDFENVWKIEEGSLPVLRRSTGGGITGISIPDEEKFYSLSTMQGILVINPLSEISINIFNVAGTKVHSVENMNSQTIIALPEGAYIVQLRCEGQNYAEKIIVK